MPDIDLFGNIIEEKDLTSMQRLTYRLAGIEGRDLYVTEPKDIERFLSALKRDKMIIPSPIWEPAAGQGDISKTLINHGYDVKSSDLYPYKDDKIDIIGFDFFAANKCEGCKTIFTNPPFNIQEEFLLHALKMNVDVIFFVRLSFLTGKRRFKIFQNYKPSYIYVFSGRAHCYIGGDRSKQTSNMIDYCLMWMKPPYQNITELRWIE